jgi:hypothetical protein
MTGGFGDPDAYLYENDTCDSSRNYSREENGRLINRQSQESDRTRRLEVVRGIQRPLGRMREVWLDR